MKAQRYFLLALFTLSALFTIDAAAQRVKPTLPEPATIEAGKFYYLFNEDTGLFMEDYRDGNYYLRGTTYTKRTWRFIYEETGDTYYIKETGDWYLQFYRWDSQLYDENTSNPDADNKWRMTQLPNGCYTIQHNYEYNANHYMSYPHSGEGGYASATDTLNRVWRLIPADDVEAARLMLYYALESVDSSYCVTPYDDILSTDTTIAGLLEATQKVRNMKSLTDQYVQRNWSDYKIAFINDVAYPWGWNSNHQRYYMPERLSGEKTRLTAIVEVDVDEALLLYGAGTSTYHGYDYDLTRNNISYDTYYDQISRHNELNVYIDGELVRNVKRDQIANTYGLEHYPYDAEPRFIEKLTKGAHTIEWEYLRNDYWDDNYSYICDVGVVKTPIEISVSLLEPGSLGTEILAQLNSVLEVRKLKIKGEMNAEDWKTLDLIRGYLYSLDLSEAVITEIPDEQFKDHPCLRYLKLPEGLTRIGNYAFYDSHVEDIVFPSTLTTVGEYAFQNSNLRDFQAAHTQLQNVGQYAFANCRYLKSVILPKESMNNIGNHAFANDRYLENVSLPKDMTSLDFCAFYECQRMRTLKLPEQLNGMGSHVFYNLDSLRSKIVFPKGLASVPNQSFRYCHNIDTLILPNDVTKVGEYAFDYCNKLKYIDLSDSLVTIEAHAFESNWALERVDFPSTLKSIGNVAFGGCGADSIIIPENTSLGTYAFNWSAMRYVELPTSYYNIATQYVFTNCSNLNRIKLKSPTLLHGNTSDFVSNKGNITLVVPDYLVSSYKLDSYWYTYKDVEGFGTSEVDTWTINNPVVLDASSRLQGTPNVNINYTTLTMQGETGMELQNLAMKLDTYSGEYYDQYWNRKYYYNKFDESSQILTSADIDVKGMLTLDYYTYGNHWAYIALPFDIKVSDIQTDAQYAIRYYDGTSRADSAAATGNWKNYAADDIIPAGTGFVYQTSLTGWTTFVAYDNASKSRAFSAKDLSAPLKANPCEVSAHRGWNLVGNPWMTWYNIHSVDFTAPITVYDQYNLCYTAYSIIDDDIALHPTQAFFVQCPEDVEAITFPARGRQLTSEIKNQNGAPALNHAVKERQLIDIQLIAGDIADKTRIVMNEKASLDYDYGSDASKFFADGNVMQLYTVGNNGLSYSINERPEADGMVDLAYIAAEKGEYTLSLTRNQASEVILTDLHTGIETDLTQADYTFTSEAGTFTGRFRLAMKSSATGIGELVTKSTVNVVDGGIQATGYIEAYALDGRRIAEGDGFVALDKGVYVVRINNVSTKVIVK